MQTINVKLEDFKVFKVWDNDLGPFIEVWLKDGNVHIMNDRADPDLTYHQLIRRYYESKGLSPCVDTGKRARKIHNDDMGRLMNKWGVNIFRV